MIFICNKQENPDDQAPLAEQAKQLGNGTTDDLSHTHKSQVVSREKLYSARLDGIAALRW